MIRPILIVAFLSSIVFLHWWVVLLLGVFLIAYSRDYLVVLIGGLMLDATYGVPLISLFGLPSLYTAVFTVLITTDMVLRNRLMD